MENSHITESENANPSTQGSGRKVFRSIPMTLMIVLIADTPSLPDLRATLAGYIQWRIRSVITKIMKYASWKLNIEKYQQNFLCSHDKTAQVIIRITMNFKLEL